MPVRAGLPSGCGGGKVGLHRWLIRCRQCGNTAADDNISWTACAGDPANNAMKGGWKGLSGRSSDFKLNIVETPWADIQTKLSTAGAAGDLSTLPDIFLMQDNAFAKNRHHSPTLTNLTDTKVIWFHTVCTGKLALLHNKQCKLRCSFDNWYGKRPCSDILCCGRLGWRLTTLQIMTGINISR